LRRVARAAISSCRLEGLCGKLDNPKLIKPRGVIVWLLDVVALVLEKPRLSALINKDKVKKIHWRTVSSAALGFCSMSAG